MPQIAFLIMAHSEAVVSERLVRRLDVPWATTFLHVDRKVNQAAFVRGMGGVSNLVFMPDAARRKVYWGTFAIAQTMFDMVRFALQQDPRVDRIFFLSGVDYPLAPLESVREAAATKAEFIRVDRRLIQGGPGEQDRLLARRNLGSSSWLNERTGVQRLRPISEMMQAVLPPPNLGEAPIYHGSSSWALTSTTLRQILALYDERPDLLDRFRHVQAPVEMVVHSAIKGLPVAAQITQDVTDPKRNKGALHPCLFGMHFIDWSRGGSGPATLALEDLQRITASGALFARKMSTERSMTLIEALDARDG